MADFGLARLSTSDTRLTQEGFTLGTPLYMSPEQVEGRPLDTRSDIYSLGVTCYHMLSGQPPFGGDTALQVAVKHLRSEPAPLGQVRSDLPPALCDLVHKMLAKEPDNRFATAQELSRSLRLIAAACGVTLDEHSHASLSARAPAVAASRQVLTRELQVLMRREPTGIGRWGWPLAAAVIVASLVGLATARLTRPKPLLFPDASVGAAPAASPTAAPAGEQATAGPPTAEAAATGPVGDKPRLNEAGMPQPAPREQGGGGGNSNGTGRRRPVGN